MLAGASNFSCADGIIWLQNETEAFGVPYCAFVTCGLQSPRRRRDFKNQHHATYKSFERRN